MMGEGNHPHLEQTGSVAEKISPEITLRNKCSRAREHQAQ